jgi:hypothetical protein
MGKYLIAGFLMNKVLLDRFQIEMRLNNRFSLDKRPILGALHTKWTTLSSIADRIVTQSFSLRH